MVQHEVFLEANAGIFEGLSKQNMEFHQCVAELVDNALAANEINSRFEIEIFLNYSDKNNGAVIIYISDNCTGMDLDIFQDALQLGKSATTESRLNEHGFGMKNALATLSGGNGKWKIWTQPDTKSQVYSAEGPFKSEMLVEDEDSFPKHQFLPPAPDISTLIEIPVSLSFVQTVQGRGAPAKDLSTLRSWLIEHLGALYRGYLGVDSGNDEKGSITVSIENDRKRVDPIPVPIGNRKRKYIDIELGGSVEEVIYEYGTLDEVERDRLVDDNRAKFYYQGNQQTQGIDIRVGNRTIATQVFEDIWRTDDDESRLSRHNRYNEFVGELRIPKLPRGILTTTNDKTEFNMEDPDWGKIFGKLNEYRPIDDVREKTESSLKDDWMDSIQATNPDDKVSDENHVWPTGTRIDVYRKTSDERVILYELKAGNGSPQHLYQLKMYWDGLVLEGEQPTEGTLLVENYNSNLQEMANRINNRLTPPEDSEPYNFRIEKHEDKGL